MWRRNRHVLALGNSLPCLDGMDMEWLGRMSRCKALREMRSIGGSSIGWEYIYNALHDTCSPAIVSSRTDRVVSMENQLCHESHFRCVQEGRFWNSPRKSKSRPAVWASLLFLSTVSRCGKQQIAIPGLRNVH